MFVYALPFIVLMSIFSADLGGSAVMSKWLKSFAAIKVLLMSCSLAY